MICSARFSPPVPSAPASANCLRIGSILSVCQASRLQPCVRSRFAFTLVVPAHERYPRLCSDRKRWLEMERPLCCRLAGCCRKARLAKLLPSKLIHELCWPSLANHRWATTGRLYYCASQGFESWILRIGAKEHIISPPSISGFVLRGGNQIAKFNSGGVASH